MRISPLIFVLFVVVTPCSGAPQPMDLREEWAAHKKEREERAAKRDQEMRAKIPVLPDAPTVRDVADRLNRIDTFHGVDYAVTPRNQAAVEKILQQLAVAPHPDVPPRIAGPDARGLAISTLGRISSDAAVLPLLKSFFTVARNPDFKLADYPYQDLFVGISEKDFRESALRFASTALHAYGQVAKRSVGEEAGLAEIVPFLQGPKRLQGASAGLDGYHSPAFVNATVQLISEAEAAFPGPWPDRDARKRGLPPEVEHAMYFLGKLIDAETPLALDEAKKIVDRWESKYRDHPDRDLVYETLAITHYRTRLPIPDKAGDVIHTHTELLHAGNPTPQKRAEGNGIATGPTAETRRLADSSFNYLTAAALLLVIVAGILVWRIRSRATT